MLAVILRRVEPGGIGSFNVETIRTGRNSERIMTVGARPPSRNFARDLIGDYYHHAGYRRTYFSRNHPALLTENIALYQQDQSHHNHEPSH